ncbi:hypothetical protein J6S88_06525 [bacterium]|nr:hypothetical protein [bacterium]
MNNIIITLKDYKEIQKYAKQKKAAQMLDDEKRFCFDDFNIQVDVAKDFRLKGTVMLDDFKIQSGRIYYYSMVNREHVTLYFKRKKGKTWIETDSKSSNDLERSRLEHEASFYHAIILGVISYIMNYPRKTIERDAKHKEAVKKSHEHKSNISYLLKDIIIYNNEAVSHHEITCDCWGVKGHYRHYKSGKVVFIKPFKKGKNKDNEIDIDYYLRKESL